MVNSDSIKKIASPRGVAAAGSFRSSLYSLVPWKALFAGLLCGAVNVLVDSDHIPYVLGIGVEFIPFNVLGFGGGRFLHSAFFLIGIIGLACATGLLFKLVLKGK